MRKRAVDLATQVRDAIAALHPEIKRKVRSAIDAIRDDPTIGDPLEQELTGFRKIVVGSWRIVFRDEATVIRIHAVGRRATVYADLIERLRRSVRERARRYRRRGTREVLGPVSGGRSRLSRRGGSRDRAR